MKMWARRVSVGRTHPKLGNSSHQMLKHDPNSVPIHNAKSFPIFPWDRKEVKILALDHDNQTSPER